MGPSSAIARIRDGRAYLDLSDLCLEMVLVGKAFGRHGRPIWIDCLESALGEECRLNDLASACLCSGSIAHFFSGDAAHLSSFFRFSHP